jgi:amino acid transporter
LGTFALFFMGIAAVTPLTVIVGGESLGFGQVRQLGTPVGYLLAALVLAVFAVGVAAMARHVPNSGAFYSYVAAGLGRPLGVATAAIALVSYNAIQIGLFGLFGIAVTAALRIFGVPGWWSLWAVLGWVVITVLGQLKIRTNAGILAVLICAEILLVLVLDAVMLAHPADGVVRYEALNPGCWPPPPGWRRWSVRSPAWSASRSRSRSRHWHGTRGTPCAARSPGSCSSSRSSTPARDGP